MATLAPPDEDAPTTGAQMRIVSTTFLTLFSVVGLVVYGLPFYYDFMVRDFGWSRAQVTSGNALSRFVIGPAFGYIAGWMIDRFGPRRLMMAGILMATIALVGLGAMSALWMFYFFYLLNALGYVCGGPLPNQVLISRWFDRTRGRAMGIAYLGIGLGGAAVPYISLYLTRHFGWRAALQIMGGIILAVAFPLAFSVKESPRSEPAARASDPEFPTQPSAVGVPLSAVLRTPAFYLLAIGSMCSIAAVGGTNQNLKLFLSLDRAYSQSESARVLSLVLAFSLAGRLLIGWLADRLPKKYVMLLTYSLVGGSIPLLLSTGASHTMVYLFAIVFGIGLGGDYMIIPLMAGELFGVAVLGRVLGIILTADGVAEAAAPMFVGYMHDVTGSYYSGFLVLIGAAVIGALAISLLPNRRLGRSRAAAAAVRVLPS